MPLPVPLWLLGGALLAGAAALAAWLWYRRQCADDASEVPTSNAAFVRAMTASGFVRNPALASALAAVERAEFVPPAALGASGAASPYADMALPIGHGATISAPHIACIGLDVLCEALAPGGVVRPNLRVLDVGSGCGYVSAVLAALVGAHGGRVVGLEHMAPLVADAQANVARAFALQPQLARCVEFVCGDGFAGVPHLGPYDAIYSAVAPPELPHALVAQLACGGRMLCPVGPPDGYHQLLRVDKDAGGAVAVASLGSVRFVPMTSVAAQLAGDGTRLRVALDLQKTYHAAPDTTPDELERIRARFGGDRPLVVQ